MAEQWRDVSGFEGRYQVSDLGRVRSITRYVTGRTKTGEECNRLRPGRILKRYQINSGYLIVHLSRGFRGARKAFTIHRLVLAAFRGLEDDVPVNHKDCNRLNNCIKNLEPTTPKANTQHAIANGRIGGRRRA